MSEESSPSPSSTPRITAPPPGASPGAPASPPAPPPASKNALNWLRHCLVRWPSWPQTLQAPRLALAPVAPWLLASESRLW